MRGDRVCELGEVGDRVRGEGTGRGVRSPRSGVGCVVGPRASGRRHAKRRRAERREGGRTEEEHSTRGERVKSARRGRQTTGIASPDC